MSIGVARVSLSSAFGAVASVVGTANQVTVAPTTGAVVVSLPTNGTLPGMWTAQSGLLVAGILNVQEGAVRSFTILNAAATVNGNGGIAFSLSFAPTFDNTVTVLGVGAWISATTQDAAYTLATMQGIRINVTKGAAATVTTMIGLDVEDVTAGGTNFAIQTGLGRVKFGDVVETVAAQESTGAGSALLGANSPATTLSAPYTWIKMRTSDGSTVYYPVWK